MTSVTLLAAKAGMLIIGWANAVRLCWNEPFRLEKLLARSRVENQFTRTYHSPLEPRYRFSVALQVRLLSPIVTVTTNSFDGAYPLRKLFTIDAKP